MIESDTPEPRDNEPARVPEPAVMKTDPAASVRELLRPTDSRMSPEDDVEELPVVMSIDPED
jgi:hypothetical protein